MGEGVQEGSNIAYVIYEQPLITKHVLVCSSNSGLGIQLPYKKRKITGQNILKTITELRYSKLTSISYFIKENIIKMILKDFMTFLGHQASLRERYSLQLPY